MAATYDPSIPAANNRPSQDQPKMQSNFLSLNQQFGRDHDGLDTASSNYGFHKQSSYIAAGDPAQSTSVAKVYSKNVGSRTELFMRMNDVSPPDVIQLTNTVLAPPVAFTPRGYSFLPGGVIIQWGQATVSDGTFVDFTSGTGRAFPNNCFVVVAQVQNPGTNPPFSVTTYNVSPGGFNVRANFPSLSISYIAIGN